MKHKPIMEIKNKESKMRVFERLATREQFSNEAEWKKGYVFVSNDVSDIIACEMNGTGEIGRMHLRSTCKEIFMNDDRYYTAISSVLSKKFPEKMKLSA